MINTASPFSKMMARFTGGSFMTWQTMMHSTSLRLGEDLGTGAMLCTSCQPYGS